MIDIIKAAILMLVVVCYLAMVATVLDQIGFLDKAKRVITTLWESILACLSAPWRMLQLYRLRKWNEMLESMKKETKTDTDQAAAVAMLYGAGPQINLREGRAMDKSILEQYTSLQAESKDLQRRIASLQRGLERMSPGGDRGIVSDTVSCGKKGKKSLGTKTVTGFPSREYSEKKNLLKRYERKLDALDKKLLKMLNEAEEYIQNIDDSRIRRILRYRYIDEMNWQQIAQNMGKNHSADSCRMAHDRFLQGRQKKIKSLFVLFAFSVL